MGLITRAELVRADVARRERLEREHGKLQRNLRSHEGDGGKSEKSSAAPGPGLLIPARASILGRFQILTPANAYVASCALSLLAFLSFHAFDAPAFLSHTSFFAVIIQIIVFSSIEGQKQKILSATAQRNLLPALPPSCPLVNYKVCLPKVWLRCSPLIAVNLGVPRPAF